MTFETRAFCYLMEKECGIRLECLEPVDLSQDFFETAFRTKLMLGYGEEWGVLGTLGDKLGYLLQGEHMNFDAVWLYNRDGDRALRVNDVYIEHENDPATINEEVTKLVHVGLGMRVLVTYDFRDDQADRCKAIAARLSATPQLPPSFRLLVIFGRLVDEQIHWAGYEFDARGDYTPVWNSAQQ